MEALYRNQSSATTAAAALSALRNLTSSREHPVPAAYFHILRVVAATLERHWLFWQSNPDPQTAIVITAACGVLRNLSRSPSNIAPIQTSGVAANLQAIVISSALPHISSAGTLSEASQLASKILASI